MRDLGERAVLAARRHDDPALIGTALMRRWTTLGLEQFAERQAVADEAVALDRQHGLPADIRASAYLMAGLAAMDGLDLAGAEAAMDVARTEAERCGRPAIVTEVGWFEALVHLAAGRSHEAEARALATYDLYRRTRALNADTILAGILLGARADSGRLDQLLEMTSSLAREGVYTFVARACMAWAGAEGGHEDMARKVVLSPAELARTTPDYLQRATFVGTAYAWWHLGIHADAAEALAARLRPWANRVAFPGSTGPFLGPVTLALARLAHLAGDRGEALRRIADTVATCERVGYPTWLARALADQADWLAGSPDPADQAAAEAVRGRAVTVALASGCVPARRRLGLD
jgi:hypothetical protein